MKLKVFLTSILFLVFVISTFGTDHFASGNDVKIIPYQVVKDGIYGDIKTNKGLIVVWLDYVKTPMTVANFIGLAEGTIKNASYPKGTPFYNGSKWHRVVPGHVIQGGSPAIDKAPEKEEASATGYEIPNEISGLSHNKAGMLGMANSGPNTNTCQFYITLGDRSYLDGNYTVFGEVIGGMDAVNKIVQGDTIISISIRRIGADAKKFIVNDETFARLVDAQWKKVKDEMAVKKAGDEKFISQNYPGLKATASGLRYKVITEGTGEIAAAGSEMTLKYTGRLIGGLAFVSTPDAGKPSPNVSPESFIYRPGKEQIINGLREGLGGMKQGEKRLLIIPPALGYGQNGFYAKNIPGQKRFVISPDQILIMEVTLISFK
jgi:cyclophilin family peptidyl-prolyl cis-trans isomerase